MIETLVQMLEHECISMVQSEYYHTKIGRMHQIKHSAKALEAKLEAVERYEASLASLADCINQELRESGDFTNQITDYLGGDLRPFIRYLVDANRKRAAAPSPTLAG